MKWFTEHPYSVGETYWQHFCFASKTGLTLFVIGTALIIHAILPAVFIDYASSAIPKLNETIKARTK